MPLRRSPVVALVRVISALVFLISALAWPAVAQGFIRLELLSAPEVDIELRGMLTVGLRVSNESSVVETCRIGAEVPSGWGYFAAPDTLDIEAGSSEVVFITVNPPVGVSAGKYAIVVNACPDGRPSEAATAEVVAVVAGVMLIEVKPSRPDEPTAYSGDKIDQTFIVTNLGNARTSVAIDIDTRQRWPVTVVPVERRLDLEPNQGGVVTVTTTVPEELVEPVSYRLTLIVRSLEPGAEKMEWQGGSTVRVIPRRLSAGPIYATLDGDIEADVSWRTDEDISVMLAMGSLEGEIMKGRRLSLGPVTLPIVGRSTGTFGQRQWMSGKYEDEGLGYIRVGDFSVDMLSPLMGRYMSGRGGDVLYRNGGTDYRAFYTRSRGSIPEENIGIQVAQDIGQDGLVRFTAFRDSELSVPEGFKREAETSTNFGLLAGYKPSEDTEVTGEIGRSSVSGSGSDNAWRLNTRYKQDRFSANCEWLRAGDDFRGGWRDTELRRTYFSWGPVEDVNLWTNYNWSRFNLAGDPDKEGRNSRDIAFGATWNVEDFGQMRVSHRKERSRDVILDEFNRSGSTTEYSLARDWGNLRMSASWQEQVDNDYIEGDRETERQLRLDCSARLNHNASIKLGYTTGRTSKNHAEETLRNTSIDLGGDVRFARGLDASFNVQRNSGGLQGNRTSVNGTLRWEMPSESRLNLNVRSYTSAYGDETEVALGFTYPLSIPLKMFPRKGGIQGRVFLADDPGKGIGNVRISVGQMEVVTDGQGYFSFPSLDPGEHQLTLETTSLGVGMTPKAELPFVFVVEAGATVELEIPVMRSVAIGGQVFLETPASQGAAPSRRPLAEMVIELQAEAGSYYRFTDSYGRFLFADLIPGKYVVILRSERLPQWHDIIGLGSYELELAPGDSRRDLEFVVAPIERGIDITTEISNS